MDEDIRERMDNSDITLLTLLDFSNAFDRIDHSILCIKLTRLFSFSSSAVKLLCFNLVNRHQYVVESKQVSSFVSVKRGVPGIKDSRICSGASLVRHLYQ